MFVSDSNIFPSSKMKIRITCPDGMSLIAVISPEATVDQLTVAASVKSLPKSLHHKVILVRNCKVLDEDKTLVEQGVTDNDEVLLLEKKGCSSTSDKAAEKTKPDEVLRGPSADEINRVTSAMVPCEKPQLNMANITTSVDFQTELRKILISLIEVSQKLLCLNPEASKVFQQAEEILNEPSSSSHQVTDDDIKQLTDMGFSELRAKKALNHNKFLIIETIMMDGAFASYTTNAEFRSVMSAMEWLLQHENDPDIDSPIQDNTTTTDEDKGATGGVQSDSKPDNQSTHGRVSNILHSLRAYRKREFKPNQKTLQHLLEMGFEESNIVEALRATRNDGDAACELLLCNKKPPPEDVDEGIEFDSPLFRAIMANPTVQLGLNNPRCLLAFIQMLEHPQTASHWLSDPETAPLLVQVSRIYHAEKNSEMQQSYETNRSKDKKSR